MPSSNLTGRVRRLALTLAVTLGISLCALAEDQPSQAVLALARPTSVHFVRHEADIDMTAEDPLPYVVDLFRVKLSVERIVAGTIQPPKELTVEITQVRGQTYVDIRHAAQIYIVLVKSGDRFTSRSKTSWGVPQKVACLRSEVVRDTDLENRFKDLEGRLVGCTWL